MRWGIAGYGWVARDYFRPGALAAGHRVAGVYDPVPEAAGNDGLRVAHSLDALLDDCDALYVATPNDRHAAPACAALAAGIPVLCEKPMAATLADAERIAAAAAASSAAYGTAFDQRWHPAHRAAAAAIAAGCIGRPTAVRIVYACWVDPRWSPAGLPNWRADPAAAGGGAVIDLALHGLDLVQLLLGEPVEALHIVLQRRIHAYDVDDGGLVSGRTAAGVLVSLHVAYNCPEALPRRRLEVVGEGGQLVLVDTMGQTAGGTLVHTCGETGEVTPLAFDTQLSPFTAQAAAFAAAVDGQPHDFSAARDIALMRRFDAAYRRAQSCR